MLHIKFGADWTFHACVTANSYLIAAIACFSTKLSVSKQPIIADFLLTAGGAITITEYSHVDVFRP